ncbi:MAG: inverse autotransporter beta domain-containing protein [Parachlamydiales bacterium]
MRSLFLALVLLLTAPAWGQQGWQPAIEPRAITNGYRKGAGADLFIPAWQRSCSLVFGEALGGYFQNDWVGSVGLGYRQLVGRWPLAFGVNGFVDGARIGRSTWGQGGIGGELFGPCWELRANGYLPFSRKRDGDPFTKSYLGIEGRGLFEYTGGYCFRERTYAGFDVEGGYGRDLFCGSLWGYAGYYRFDAKSLTTIQGPRVRLVYRYDRLLRWTGSQLIAGLLYEHDGVHGNRVGVELALRIPLGCPARSTCCPPSSIMRRMGYRVVRQEGILSGCEEVVFGITGKPVLGPDGLPQELLFIAAKGDGEGSRARPITLDKGLASAGPHAILILTGGDYPTSGITLAGDQSLRGFGPKGELQLAAGDLTLTLKERGRARLVGTKGAKTVLTLPSGTSVSGIAIEGGEVALATRGRTSVTDVTIGQARHALRIDHPDRATFKNLAVSDIGDWLLIAEGGSALTIDGLKGEKGLDNGIRIAKTTDLKLEGVALKLDGDVGIELKGCERPSLRKVTIDGRDGRNPLDYGINLVETTGARLEEVALYGMAGYALLIERATDTTIEKLVATTSADEVIRVAGGEGFTLRNSEVGGGKDTLLSLYDLKGKALIIGTTFEGALNGKRSAVEITTLHEAPLLLTLSKSTLRNAAGGGLLLDARGASQVDLKVADSTFEALKGTALLALQSGAKGSLEMRATNNRIATCANGIALKTAGSATESEFHYHLGDNTLRAIAGEGIVVAHEAFAKGAATLSGTVTHNTLDEVGTGIHLRSDLSPGLPHVFNALAQGNQLTAIQRRTLHLDIEGDSGGEATFKILGNRDMGDSKEVPFEVDVGPRFKGRASLTMSGNTSSRPEAKILLRDQSGGHLEVEGMARLSEENGSLGVLLQ